MRVGVSMDLAVVSLTGATLFMAGHFLSPDAGLPCPEPVTRSGASSCLYYILRRLQYCHAGLRHDRGVPANLGDWMRVVDAAVELKVSPRHVRLLIARGRLRATSLSPRLYLVERASVEDY